MSDVGVGCDERVAQKASIEVRCNLESERAIREDERRRKKTTRCTG